MLWLKEPITGDITYVIVKTMVERLPISPLYDNKLNAK